MSDPANSAPIAPRGAWLLGAAGQNRVVLSAVARIDYVELVVCRALCVAVLFVIFQTPLILSRW